MKTLAIDPGTKDSGIFVGDINQQYLTWTIRAKGPEEMRSKLKLLIDFIKPDRLVIEDFTHRKYVQRRINTGPDMGKMLGYLQGSFENIELFPAEKTKQNMAFARKQFPNGHEFSAYCVANYAAGVQRVRG